MLFSVCSRKYYRFSIFLKKCKQTAEISWLFIWDVKISKNSVKQSFCIFNPHVRSYFGLCSPTPQKPKTVYLYPCFVITPIYIWPGFPRQIFYISLSTTQFWILWKKIQSKLDGKYSKLEKTTKQVQTHKIFITTLIKKFSVADYWYMLYKFTQYTWALSSSLFCHI